MLLYIGLCASLSFDYECVAPLRSPAPVAGGVLEQVVLLTRHGFRAPFDTYRNFTSAGWRCDDDSGAAPPYHTYGGPLRRRFHAVRDPAQLLYRPSCAKAELTVAGQQQHYELGRFYRSYLGAPIDPGAVRLRASSPDRCVKSAISFANGLCPADAPDDTAELVTGTDASEVLHPREELCGDIADMWARWTKSPEYAALKREAEPLLRALVEESGLDWGFEYNWLWVGDWLYTLGCCAEGAERFPAFISQAQLDVAIRAVEFFTLRFFQYERGVAGAPILREVLRALDRTASMEDRNRFTLLSAHDVSIVSAAALLGVNLEKIPPFRSHMAFEKWRIGSEIYMRVVLNGEVIVETTSYIRFRQMVLPYLHYCLVP